MFVEKRKAHIEWINKRKIILTNIFQQKSFNLKHDLIIDLITFKTVGNYSGPQPSNFYLQVNENFYNPNDVDGNDPSPMEKADFWLDIYAQTSEDDWEHIDRFYPQPGGMEKAYSINLWTK